MISGGCVASQSDVLVWEHTRFAEYDTWLYYRNIDVGGGNGTRLGLCAKMHQEPVIWKIGAINSNKEAKGRPTASFGGLRDTSHSLPGFRICLQQVQTMIAVYQTDLLASLVH